MTEIIIVMGYPASGKTTLTSDFEAQGYTRINRDTLGGTVDGLVDKIDALLPNKQLFVLDNLYTTVESRKAIIAYGRRQKIPVKCVWLDTSIEDAQYNAVKRMVKKYGKILHGKELSAAKDPGTFPPIVLFKYRKDFEAPTLSEGFSSVKVVSFQRRLDPTYKNKAILLDYDGTLRETLNGDKFPTSEDNIRILPRRKEILQKYVSMGYKLLGISNQSGIAKGDLTEADAIKCFAKTNAMLGLDIDVSFCPHSVPPISCYCRKPMPGIPVEFIEKYKLDPASCIIVGDLKSDSTTARRCGMQFSFACDFFK